MCRPISLGPCRTYQASYYCGAAPPVYLHPTNDNIVKTTVHLAVRDVEHKIQKQKNRVITTFGDYIHLAVHQKNC